MKRANYIGVPAIFNLNHSVLIVNQAFDEICYLVGSAIEKRDYRDVDVRCILDDEKFDRMFPGAGKRPAQYHMLLSFMNTTTSEWLSQRTGLPIDFQFQRRTEANTDHPGVRQALGIYPAFVEKGIT